MTDVIYECGICDCYHPWNWNGDCRDDKNRYGSPEEYAEQFGISGTNLCALGHFVAREGCSFCQRKLGRQYAR